MEERLKFWILYGAICVSYLVAGGLIYNTLVESPVQLYTLPKIFYFGLASVYVATLFLSFLNAPVCARNIAEAENRKAVFWNAVGLTICLIPSIGGLYFENRLLSYSGETTQVKNRIDIEILPEVRVAKENLQNSELALASLKKDTSQVGFARLQIGALTLTIQKLDTSSRWDRRLRADQERKRRENYEGQVSSHLAKINVANQAVERDRGILSQVRTAALEKYADKSWAEVSGEKLGFNPLKMLSGVLSMGVALALTAIHILMTFLYGNKKERKTEEVVSVKVEPVKPPEPNVVEQKWGPEFMRKYAREDMFLKCVARGAKSFAEIQEHSRALGFEINKETARLTIWDKKLMNPTPELAEYIRDWEQKNKMKLKDFRNRNGAYHEA